MPRPMVAGKMRKLPGDGAASLFEASDCRVIIMPGLGHVPHLEASDSFNARLLDFLRF